MTSDSQLREEAIYHNLHRTTLSNGLRVWVKPRPGTGTVALLLQVPVGSRHETKANNGISHFLEHLVFTGTAQWDELQVMEVIRRRGGTANARTGVEDTVYWLNLKADDLALGVEWLAEVVFRATLPAEKFEKERAIIIEEKGGEIGALKRVGDWIENNGLGWNVFRAVQHRLFPQSSILLPVIGEDASLRALHHADLIAFYQEHYLPNNATLVVVGDVTPEAVLAAVEAQLGALPAGPLPPRPAPLSPRPGSFNVRLSGPNLNNQGQVLFGAPIPGLNHPDRWALSVLAEILDTQLTDEIRFRRGLVYSIEIYPAMYSDQGYFVVYTIADSGKFNEILAEVTTRLERVLAGELTAEQVQAAQAALRGRQLLGIESNVDLGWLLAEQSLVAAPNAPLPDMFAAVAAVTPEDVQRVAQTYLLPEQRYQAIHRPGLTPAALARPALVLGAALVGGLGWWWWQKGRKK